MSTTDDHGHIPVLINEVLEQLAPNPSDVIVDCTAGRGGHSVELAKCLDSRGQLILFDLDPENLSYSDARIRSETSLEPICILRSFAAAGRELLERGLKANCVLPISASPAIRLIPPTADSPSGSTDRWT